MAMTTIIRLAFINVISAIARRIAGIAIMPSMTRIITASTGL